MSIFSLVYVSSATVPFSDDDLLALLQQSRRDNASRAISGMLLYRGGNFMQLLEGDEQRVRQLYVDIAADTRHSGSLILLTAHEEERMFPEWSMAFRNMNDEDVRTLPGFNTFLNTGTNEKDPFADPTRAQKLLRYFKSSMR